MRLLQKKNVGACICLFVVQGLPQPQQKTDRETTTLEYTNNRKVCVEDTRPSQHTTESIYYTPWSYLCNVFVCCSIVEVLNDQKQSVSNAFQYVVLCPVAPSPSDDIPAARGQMRLQKYKNKMGNSTESVKKL